MADEIYEIFQRYKVLRKGDMLDILQYFKQYYVGDRQQVQDAEKVMKKQLKTLSLSERNKFHRILTFSASETGALNEDMLTMFPFLRKRSMELLTATRQVRKDKIDLTFIDNFMHDICRVNTSGEKIKVGVNESGEPIYHLYEVFLNMFCLSGVLF